MARVEVICGTARSDRPAAMERRFLEAPAAPVLVLPTRQAAQARAMAMAKAHQLPGFLGAPICTFQDFAQGIVAGTAYEGARIGTVEQRLVLERVFDGLRKSKGFREAGAGAETEGFLNHAQRVIAQLKQGAIEPDRFRELVARRQGRTGIDGLLTELYTGYQDALRAQNVYDLQGLYWSAHLACADGSTVYFSNRRIVLFEGFDDFTVSELRLIYDAADLVDQVVVGLHGDLHPDRHDLYRRPLEISEHLYQGFEIPEVADCQQPTPSDHIAFVARHLFWRDEPPAPPPTNANVKLIACHTLLHEFETAARRIKRLTIDGAVPLDRVAVVMGDTQTHGALLASVFEEFGVPLRLPFGIPLGQSAAVKMFGRALEAMDRWTQSAVLDVLQSPQFRPGGEAVSHRDMAPLVARLAQLVDGRNEWIGRSARLAEDLKRGAPYYRDVLARVPDGAEGAASIARAVSRLAECADAWPREATLGAFARAADGLVDRLGMTGEDVATLRAVLRRLAVWTAKDEHAISRVEFARRLNHALGNEQSASAGPRHGVVCLDLEAARHLTFDHVYLVHANEGELPSRPPFNAIYNEAELDAWRAKDVPFEIAAIHAEREMLLFQRLFECAQQSITLSWHTLARNGQPRQASPYVHDVRALLPGVAVEHLDSRSAIVAPEAEYAMAPRDGAAVAMLGGGPDGPGVAGRYPRAVAGALLERTRYAETPFESHDGILSEGDVLRAVQATYGKEHRFSANQLELYLDCPFRFFVERILRLLPTEQPEETFDRRIYGIILHDALRRFHLGHAGESIGEIPEATARAELRARGEEAFDAEAKRSITAPSGVADVERRRILNALDLYITIERTRDTTLWKPTYFELCFGAESREGDDPHSSETPFALDTDAGPVAFTGRIDRVDMDGAKSRLIDYKTSPTIQTATITSGKNIQLGLYSLAIEQSLFRGSECADAWYLPVGRKAKAYTEALAKSGRAQKKWPERQEILLGAIAEAVTGIREGRFHPTVTKEACAYCPLGNVCRHERARMERKAGPTE